MKFNIKTLLIHVFYFILFFYCISFYNWIRNLSRLEIFFLTIQTFCVSNIIYHKYIPQQTYPDNNKTILHSLP